jgi:hypothetical protein
MMHDILRKLEKRRTDLIYLLDARTEQFDPDEQHQIFGAIKELENIIEIICT